jgi:MFS transporter, UMF1 family
VKRLPRGAIAWALYDWAASAYALCILAAFFPIAFETYWAADLDPARETFWYGIFVSGASLIGALIAPILGSLADRGGSRKRWLGIFALVGIVGILGLTLVARGHWVIAGLTFVVGTVGYYGASICYNSLLPEVSDKDSSHLVSGIGFAAGYLGGVLLFVASILFVQDHERFGIGESMTATHIVFVVAAIWWAIFTIPLLRRVPQQTPPAGAQPKILSSIWSTLTAIRTQPQLLWFLIAYLFYQDGVNTVISMASNYAKTLGFETSTVLETLVVAQLVGVPATLLIAWLGQRFGPRPFLFAGIGLYICIVTYGALMPTHAFTVAGMTLNPLLLLGALVGVGQGGIQSLSRSHFASLIPSERSASYFGFYNMLGQYASLIGPLLVGVTTRATGNVRLGLVSLIVLFALGALSLWRSQRLASA